VLATPFTACLVAFGRYVPSLEPLAILLSDAQALPPAERLYQRLLARDVYEATALVAERTEALGALSAWDEVVMLALGLLERDRHEQRLDSALDAEQLDVARETFELLLRARSRDARRPRTAVLCLPARGGWDEVVCAALARFLAALGVPAQVVGHKLSTELAAEVADTGVECVCISSLGSPSGAAQHLVMRIRKRCPKTKIVVGLWGQRVDAALPQRSRADGHTYVVSRLCEARDLVCSATLT
jgi:hypothetical protein